MRYANRAIILLISLSLATTSSAMLKSSPEAKVQTFTISGNAGLPGVIMKGIPGEPVTDQNGKYSAAFRYGWSGTITPVKEGYLFEPASKVYRSISSDYVNQDFRAKIIRYTISGQVGIPGIRMQGLPGNIVTDNSGYYTCTIDYGWSGTVKPVKEGYVFSPPRLSYTKLIGNQEKQNYKAKLLAFTISDVIEINGSPVPGVRVLASDGQSTVTDSRGRFSITVPYGWSGELKLEKEGLVFDPPTQPFNNVVTNISNGRPESERPVEWQFVGGRWEPLRAGLDGRGSRRGGRSSSFRSSVASTTNRKVLIVPSKEVRAEDLAEITEDMQVMSHILDERFKESRRVQGVFTDFGDFFGRDNRQTEATYLQGYGVLFSMEVNFAFSPPPKPQVKVTEQNARPVDSTWQQAKRQVFAPGESARSFGIESTEKYNSQMVEELKRDLVATLKHAANIRGVQSDEWIILTVIGGGHQSGGVYGGGMMMGGGMMGGGMMGGGMMGGGMGGFGGSFGGDSSGGGMMGGMSSGMSGMGGGMMGGMGRGMSGFGKMDASPATVLTIRAKKSDIDAYAKGEQILTEFEQKVQILTY